MKQPIDCEEARGLILDDRKDRLSSERRADLDAHLVECADCRKLRDAESALDGALRRLPRSAVPASLAALAARGGAMASTELPVPRASNPVEDAKRAVEPAVSEPQAALPKPDRDPSEPKGASHRWRRIGPQIALVVTLAAALFLMVRFVGTGVGDDGLVREAVNDHLRVLYSERPIEIESGGIHQVKPWFAGRVDFAPALAYAGDDDFVLAGGSVAYMMDRKAAVFHFRHKLHQISLFVFRAEGLPWPAANEPIGRVRAHTETTRGFHVVTWRDGDLGYVLVSDVDARELQRLAERILDPDAPPR